MKLNALPSMKLKDRLFILMQHIIPQHFLSRSTGLLAESEIPWLKNFLIRAALSHFNIDLSSARIQDPLSFRSFNAFFTRELAVLAHELFPLFPNMGSPVEGLISQLGVINAGDLIQAKGCTYSPKVLLANHDWSKAFQHGKFATIYLAPHNYHRVHCPVAGKLVEMAYVPGKLFSVNLTTAEHINQLFARNERMIFYIETEQGKVALVMVGALLVAGMKNPFVPWSRKDMKKIQHHRFPKPIDLTPGDELGFFDFGSTVVMCFENSALSWNVPINTTLRLGQTIAHL